MSRTLLTTLFHSEGTRSIWQRIPSKRSYGILRALLCCSTAWVPLISGYVVNLIATPGFPIEKLVFYSLLGVGIEIFSYAFNIWLNYFWQKNILVATVKLKETVWRRVQHLSARRWEALPPGAWASRIERDAGVVLEMLRSLLDFSISTTVSFLFASVVIVWKVPSLWAALVVFGALQVLTYVRWTKPFRHNARRIRELDYTSGEIHYTLITMTPLFKTFGVTARFFPMFDNILVRTMRRSLASSKLGIRYNTLIQAETWGIRLFVLGFCLWLYTKSRITLGDIVVYNMYVGQLIGIVMGITGILPSVETGCESANAFTELLQWCKADRAHGVTKVDGQEIVFDRLTFQYPGAVKPIIRNFSAVIKRGESACFVGRSGTGKSTLLKLLLGIYQPTTGKVSTLKDCVFVPQRNVIYDDTLLENIRLRDQSITEREVFDTACQCGMRAFLKGHPLYMKIKPDAISGGELQLLGIVRAMVRNPKVLLLDELTNNLDILAQETIQNVLDALSTHCTIISVTHNLRATYFAKRFFLFGEGRIREISGAPQEREQIALRLLNLEKIIKENN